MVHCLFDKNPWLKEIFLFQDGKLLERFKHKGVFGSLRTQVLFFRSRFQSHVLFFRIGKYVEVFGRDALLLNKLFGLKIKDNYRGIRHAAGFPRCMGARFITETLCAGYSLVLVEEGVMGRYIRERYPRDIYSIVGVAYEPQRRLSRYGMVKKSRKKGRFSR